MFMHTEYTEQRVIVPSWKECFSFVSHSPLCYQQKSIWSHHLAEAYQDVSVPG